MAAWFCRLAWVIGLVTLPVAATAQTAYCDRLRADLAALDAGGGTRNPYADSIRRQRNELDRTVAYARSIGCQRQRFIIFSEPGPAQCSALESQIARLESNLAGLEDQAQRGASQAAGQRAAMAAAYDANCRGAPQATRARVPQPGLLERLFGAVPEQDPYQDPEMPPEPLPPDPADPMVGGAFKTICVRKCDGYYFPISPRSSRGQVEADASLCQASCPNAEVELFMQPAGQEVDGALAMDGTSYSSLPNAFRYRKTVDSACTCRRPGETWVETLAGAEHLLEGSRDQVVTEQRAQELSRAPDPAKAKAQTGKTAKGQPSPGKATAAGQTPAAAPGAPAAAANPAAPLASVPTAGSESSGIGGSGTTGSTTLGEKQGEQREVTTPTGKKTVRIVAPTLGPALVQTP